MTWQKRDRWYSASGQSRSHAMANERSGGSRRLISLIIMLVLVVMLIQQTSDTGKVAQVAHSIGLLPKPSVGTPTKDSPKKTSLVLPSDLAVAGGNASTQEVVSKDSELAFESVMLTAADSQVHRFAQFFGALFSKASPSVIDSLVRKVTFVAGAPSTSESATRSDTDDSPAPASPATPKPTAEPLQAVSEWLTGANITVDQWLEIDPANQQLADFRTQLQAGTSWLSASTSTSVAEPPELLKRSLALALDRRVLRHVVDSSPWKTTERVAFLRSWLRVDILQEQLRSSGLLRSQLPLLDTAQLSSQADFYRGKPIRFRGTIVRIDANGSITDPVLQRREYFIVWIRPDESSNQPVCVYVDSDNAIPISELSIDTNVEIAGTFFKRLAYASQRGGDVAPLLLAAEMKPLRLSSESTDKPANVSESSIFAQLYSQSLSFNDWSVPVDLDTPQSLLDQQLAPALRKFANLLVAASPSDLHNQPEAFASLFELDRCAPEIDTILSSNRSWSADEQVSLRKVRGIITQVQKVAIDTASLPSYQAAELFRCTLSKPVDCQKSDEKLGAEQVDVIVEQIPAAWHKVSSVVQPCEISGAWFTPNSNGDPAARPVMLAHAVDWINAEQVNLEKTEPKLTSWQQSLLKMGWNLRWNDSLKELHNKPLSQSDTQAYYRLLGLAYRSQQSKMFGLTDGIPILDVIKFPNNHNMDRTSMQAKIVRVTKVNVDDPEQSRLLGSGSYYQMDAFADIGQTSIQMRNSSGGDPVVFDREFPVTLVSIEAPSWLLSQSESTATETVWYPRTHVQVSGWFYRFWSYKTEQLSSSSVDTQRQVTPLIAIDAISFGTPNRPGSSDSTANGNISLTTIGTALFGLAAICWFAFRFTKKSRLKSFSVTRTNSFGNSPVSRFTDDADASR